MFNKRISGVLLATAAAALFSTASIAADNGMAPAEAKCAGVNACKGKSACASASNACKGQNSCKGKGWMSMSKSDCTAQGGTDLDDEKK